MDRASTYIADRSTVGLTKFVREAGKIRRCHTQTTVGEYTVAEHTFNMLCMLKLLYPEAPIEVIHYILGHDIPERLTGDIPATAKWFGIIDERLDTVEDAILKECGFYTKMEEEWYLVVKCIDLLELYLWCRDQDLLGNQCMRKMQNRIDLWFDKLGHRIPAKIQAFLHELEERGWNYCSELGD